MTAKAGLIPVAAVLLVALVGGSFSPDSVRAEDTCLEAPNSKAPQGSHWYYRTDQSTQQKCWYLKPLDSPHAGSQPKVDVATWADPASPLGATAVTWPDPPSLPASDAVAAQILHSSADVPTQGATAETTPAVQIADQPAQSTLAVESADAAVQSTPTVETANEAAQSTLATESANPAPEFPPKAATRSDNEEPNDQPVDEVAAAPVQSKAFQIGPSQAAILLALIGLLLSGVLVRGMVTKALRRRRAVRTDRLEPVLIASSAGNRMMPTLLAHSPTLVPGHADTDPRIDEVEEALRKLARRLRRPRTTPFKTIPPFFSGEPVD